MTSQASMQLIAPVAPIAPSTRTPLAIPTVRLAPDSRLGAWQARNAAATIPHCVEQLEAAGNLDNFRRVTGESDTRWRGFWFADSDVYKTIEAVAWEIARSGTHAFDAWLDDVIGLVGRTQEADGYVMTWILGVHHEKKSTELPCASGSTRPEPNRPRRGLTCTPPAPIGCAGEAAARPS